MYGAIGSCLKKPIYSVGLSTNKEDFLQFLKMIKSDLGRQKAFLVYDNHRSHLSKVV